MSDTQQTTVHPETLKTDRLEAGPPRISGGAPTGGPVEAGAEVEALLVEQRDLYRQLSRLSRSQRGLITGGQPDRLLAMLGERQQLIDRLGAIATRLRPYQANWRPVRQVLSEDQGRRIDGLLAEVNTMLSEVLKTDAEDAALLSARKSETHRAIGAVQAGRQAGRAYAASAGNAATGSSWA